MAQSSRHKPKRPRPHTPPRPRGPWANGPIPVVGLVGGIGAGKSLAAAGLAGLGLQVLDADKIGHALLDQRPSRDLVLERFGSGVIKAAGESAGAGRDEPEIDRKVLGQVVFADPIARRDLERILHPAMRKTFARAIDRAGRNGTAGVVLDAAVLYEAGWNDLCDTVVFVDAPADVRLGRVLATRGWSAAEVEVRERCQSPLDAKRARADHVVENSGDPEAFRAAVAAWWSSFLPARRPRGQPGARRP